MGGQLHHEKLSNFRKPTAKDSDSSDDDNDDLNKPVSYADKKGRV